MSGGRFSSPAAVLLFRLFELSLKVGLANVAGVVAVWSSVMLVAMLVKAVGENEEDRMGVEDAGKKRRRVWFVCVLSGSKLPAEPRKSKSRGRSFQMCNRCLQAREQPGVYASPA